MKRFLNFLSFFLGLILTTAANDGMVISHGGGVEPLESTPISIEREDLMLEFLSDRDLWRVSVVFFLRNPGASDQSGEVAFINHSTKAWEQSGEIRNFRTWINEREAPFRYHRKNATKPSEGGPVYDEEFFVSDMVFQPGLSTIRHEYETYGSVGGGPSRRGIYYTLETAKKWNGPIRQFNLTVKLPPNSILLPDFGSLFSKLEPFGEYRIRATDKSWDEKLYVRQGGLFASIPNFVPPSDLFFEIYDWQWYLQYHPLVPREDHLDLWSLSTRLVTPVELERYGKAELRILRNAIYALHGRPFESKDLRDHFLKFTWYLPSESFREDFLSGIEKANVAAILAREAEVTKP